MRDVMVPGRDIHGTNASSVAANATVPLPPSPSPRGFMHTYHLVVFYHLLRSISHAQVETHPDVVDLNEVLEQHDCHVHRHRLLRLWRTASKSRVEGHGTEAQNVTTRQRVLGMVTICFTAPRHTTRRRRATVA